MRHEEKEDEYNLRMRNLDYVQLILNPQVPLQQLYELDHGIEPCPGRLRIVEGFCFGGCRGAWRGGRRGDGPRKRNQRPNMPPGLLENCAEIIFETINLAARDERRFMYLCHRTLYGLPCHETQSVRAAMDVVKQTYVALSYGRLPQSFLPQC